MVLYGTMQMRLLRLAGRWGSARIIWQPDAIRSREKARVTVLKEPLRDLKVYLTIIISVPMHPAEIRRPDRD